MLQRLSLRQVGPTDALSFDFDERLNVITGDNGLGKSFVLDVAWWALTRTWAGAPALGRRTAGRRRLPSGKYAHVLRAPKIEWHLRGKRRDVSAEATVAPGDALTEWTRSQGRPPLVGLVLYARIDGGFSLWDPARNYWWDRKQSRPPAFHFTREEVWFGKPLDDPGRICEGLIRDWRDWEATRSPSFDLLRELLTILSPVPSERMEPGGPARVLDDNDGRRIPMLKLPYGEVPLIHASAGMRRVLALAYLLVWSWEKHRETCEARGIEPERRMVFLIDEVEAHLHPRWQRVIVPALLAAVAAVRDDIDVQVLLTTHAPLVLASLEPHFREDVDQLFNFRLDEGRVVVERPDFEKEGDASAWLTSGVFGLAEARSPEAEAVLEEAEAFLSGEGGTAAAARKLQGRLAEHVPPTDTFWAMWRFGLRRKGLAERVG